MSAKTTFFIHKDDSSSSSSWSTSKKNEYYIENSLSKIVYVVDKVGLLDTEIRLHDQQTRKIVTTMKLQRTKSTTSLLPWWMTLDFSSSSYDILAGSGKRCAILTCHEHWFWGSGVSPNFTLKFLWEAKQTIHIRNTTKWWMYPTEYSFFEGSLSTASPVGKLIEVRGCCHSDFNALSFTNSSSTTGGEDARTTTTTTCGSSTRSDLRHVILLGVSVILCHLARQRRHRDKSSLTI